VTDITICEEGLNYSGDLAITAFFQGPDIFETRAAVFRACSPPL
jgi:hypothetical protein